MALLPISDVKPDMVLIHDVLDMSTGTIILSRGNVLNEKKIFYMKNFDVKYVDVMKPKDIVVVKDEEFTMVRDALINKIQQVFYNVKIGNNIIVSEINKEIDDFIRVLTESNSIIARLRQLEDEYDYTFKHSLNVSMLAIMLGKWLNYSQIELKQLALAGIFHDIGKLKIPGNIINKPAKLNEEEFEIIKQHTIHSYNILIDTDGICENITLGALQHHERENGSGYPLKLKSEKIHEFGKIICVCDIYDAMTSVRVYKDKESPFKVAEIIKENSFDVLDPRISLVFLNNISKFYIGNMVMLNDGEVGEIIYVHKENPERPVVKAKDKFIDLLTHSKLQIIDLII